MMPAPRSNCVLLLGGGGAFELSALWYSAAAAASICSPACPTALPEEASIDLKIKAQKIRREPLSRRMAVPRVLPRSNDHRKGGSRFQAAAFN